MFYQGQSTYVNCVSQTNMVNMCTVPLCLTHVGLQIINFY